MDTIRPLDVWADSGTIVAPSEAKILTGFEPIIESYRTVNFAFNKYASILAEVIQKGAIPWDAFVQYPAGGKVFYAGNSWRTLEQTAIGEEPSVSSKWILDDKNVVGDIILYTDSTWVDNVTKPGWYSCVADNSIHGCPDLEDKFVKQAINSVEEDGGSHTIGLVSGNMPKHSHTGSSTSSGSHSHSIELSHTAAYSGTTTMFNNSSPSIVYYPTVTSESSHSHTIETVASGSGSDLDIQPAYIKALYVRKCY